MTNVNDVRDMLMTEIDSAAAAQEIWYSLASRVHPDWIGFDLCHFSDSCNRRILIAAYHFRTGADGQVEFAVYDRGMWEEYDPNNLCWMEYDVDRFSIEEHYEEVLMIADQPLH